MRRLASAFSLLFLTVALAGCSGGSTPVLTDVDRAVTEHGGGTPPQPPVQPRGCPECFDIRLETRMNPEQEPFINFGHLLVDACANPNEPRHAFIAFKLRDQAPILRIPGIRVDCPEGGAGDCFAGHREERRGTPEHGALIVWNTHFSIVETVEGVRVRGDVVRNRTRWFVDPNGERREHTDRMVSTFNGRPGDCPHPPPPPPPSPPGDGGGNSGPGAG